MTDNLRQDVLVCIDCRYLHSAWGERGADRRGGPEEGRRAVCRQPREHGRHPPHAEAAADHPRRGREGQTEVPQGPGARLLLHAAHFRRLLLIATDDDSLTWFTDQVL